jgi:hypothetical protein
MAEDFFEDEDCDDEGLTYENLKRNAAHKVAFK